MCKLFNQWENEIRDYCINNNLNFEKAKKMPKCWGKDDLILQYFDPDCEAVKKGLGLLDETPMPVVLWIKKINGNLVFEQTEYTRTYLS